MNVDTRNSSRDVRSFHKVKVLRRGQRWSVTFAARLLLGAEVGGAERPRPGWWAPKVGGGWMRGGVWPKALRPRWWESSCW